MISSCASSHAWPPAAAPTHRITQLDHLLYRTPQVVDATPVDIPPELEDQYRLIQYAFPAEFLKARTIGTALVFSVGNQEV